MNDTDNLKKFKKPLVVGAATFFMTFALSVVIYYIIYPSAAYFHSDCSDTILWAQASVDSKSLFNPDFGYAATLPFGGTMIMIPLVALFGVGMTAQHIGMVIFALLMFASFWLVCRSIKLSTPASLFTVGVLALTFCASEKLREIFYEHVIYYSICVVMICVLLSLLIRFEEAHHAGNGRKAIAFALLAAVFSFCGALDGMQAVAMGILPVLFAAVAEAFLSARKITCEENRTVGIASVAVLIGAAVGTAVFSVISSGVDVGYSGAYSSYANMDEWIENLGKFPVEWFELFGVDAYYGMKIFSFDSVINIVRIAASVLVLLVPVVGLLFLRKLEKVQRYTVLAHFGVSAVIMFGFVFGILSSANWRLSPMICTAVLATAATFAGLRKSRISIRFEAVAACLLALLSVISINEIVEMPQNGIELNPKYGLVKELEARGLDRGYATFWNCQTITVLSDSRVMAANIDVNEDGIAPAYYQANKNWFKKQEGQDKYFVLLSDEETETLRKTDDWFLFEVVTEECVDLDGWNIFITRSLIFLEQ